MGQDDLLERKIHELEHEMDGEVEEAPGKDRSEGQSSEV